VTIPASIFFCIFQKCGEKKIGAGIVFIAYQCEPSLMV